MAKTTATNVKKVTKKLLEFQGHGLKQYGKYLDDQLKKAGNKKSKQAYVKYLNAQVIQNDKRVKKLKDKIKGL